MSSFVPQRKGQLIGLGLCRVVWAGRAGEREM